VVVGLKTQEALAEFRKAVKHGGSLPCFTRDNLVLMMAEFDRLETENEKLKKPKSSPSPSPSPSPLVAAGGWSVPADKAHEMIPEGTPTHRTIITTRGTGREKRTYRHSYVVRNSLWGGYTWSAYLSDTVWIGSGTGATFEHAAQYARATINTNVNRQEADRAVEKARERLYDPERYIVPAGRF
jgi:hypothetical protein